MVVIVNCLLTEKIYLSLKKFENQFCLGKKSNEFDCVEAEEVSLRGNLYNFWVDMWHIKHSEVLHG